MEDTPRVGIDRLLEILKATGKKYDLEKIQAAFAYADNLHAGQFRNSGDAAQQHHQAQDEREYLTHQKTSICGCTRETWMQLMGQ